MKPAMFDGVNYHGDDNEDIRQSKERQWTIRLNEIERYSRNGGRHNVETGEQHQAFVNIEFAPVVECEADQNSKRNHVTNRNDQKL